MLPSHFESWIENRVNECARFVLKFAIILRFELHPKNRAQFVGSIFNQNSEMAENTTSLSPFQTFVDISRRNKAQNVKSADW